jgi:hypothetical protein
MMQHDFALDASCVKRASGQICLAGFDLRFTVDRLKPSVGFPESAANQERLIPVLLKFVLDDRKLDNLMSERNFAVW